MRPFLSATLFAILATSSGTWAQNPQELLTAADTILCVDPNNLDIANHPKVASSQIVLRSMGCLKVVSGIRTQLVGPRQGHLLQVRLFPTGISSGVILWALPSTLSIPSF